VSGSAVAGPLFFLLWWNGDFAGVFAEVRVFGVVLLW
jgi:hypothetical protein